MRPAVLLLAVAGAQPVRWRPDTATAALKTDERIAYWTKTFQAEPKSTSAMLGLGGATVPDWRLF